MRNLTLQYLHLAVLELDDMGAEGQAIQDALAKKLGRSRVTVPQVCTSLRIHLNTKQLTRSSSFKQIFIGGQHVGGCDDLRAAQSTGKLEKMLEDLAKTEVPSS